MSSHIIRAQTDDDTFFVLVEDTVSLQSFGTVSLQSFGSDDNKQEDTSDRNYCLLDKPVECSINPDVHGFVDVPSIEDGIDEHFIDELMSAMEEEDVHVLLNESDDDEENKTNVPTVRELLITTEPNVNVDATFEKFDAEHYEDTLSIQSYNSDFSNKSFVLVASKDQPSPIEDRKQHEDEKEKVLNISVSSTGSISDTKRSDISSYSERTGDIISIDGLENPVMEYDDMWQLCAQTTSPGHIEERQTVLIRELSYEDELRDAEGIDLMAPVFLAITGEEDEEGDHVNDMKRKTKSIEDLCSVSLNDNRRHVVRSVSDVTLHRTTTKTIFPIGKKKSFSLEKIIDNEDMKMSFDDTDGMNLLKKSLSIKSYVSFDDLRLSSLCSGGPLFGGDDNLFRGDDNDTFDDPDAFIDSIYEDGGEDYDFTADIRYPSDEMLETISFSSCQSWKELSETECVTTNEGDEETIAEPVEPSPPQGHMFACKDKNALKRSPACIPGTQCGFLEYPYGERSGPVGSPQKVRCVASCNTSPSSPPVDASSKQKRILVNINGEQRFVDMKLITPYLKVLSHGGHHRVGNECHDIVVFTACFLPPKTTKNYTVIMEQLFFYCVHAVDLIVANTYEIVFFNSALESKNMPSRKWIKKYYDLIFYKLRKNLKNIYFVHQSLWLKAALRFSKLIVSSKFREKIHLVKNIQMLQERIPLDYVFIPPSIYKIDETFQ